MGLTLKGTFPQIGDSKENQSIVLVIVFQGVSGKMVEGQVLWVGLVERAQEMAPLGSAWAKRTPTSPLPWQGMGK